jgi:hypothetical protein
MTDTESENTTVATDDDGTVTEETPTVAADPEQAANAGMETAVNPAGPAADTGADADDDEDDDDDTESGSDDDEEEAPA